MAKKIIFDNISFGYTENKPLFKDLSFSIEAPDEKGYIVGLMGDSGCGKSTLLKLILGTEHVQCGNLNIQPRDPKPVISYVPQEPVLFEHLTPLENAMYFSKTKRFKKSFNHKRFKEMAALLDKSDWLGEAKSINAISGGQKQRISLLRALSINPDILLLDEPLTGLDERIKYSFLVDLARLAQEYKILMVYVTHYRQEIELISNEIVFLKIDKSKNNIHEVIQRPTSVFFDKPPTLSALYLSNVHVTNVLPIIINSNGVISLDKKENTNICICFHQETILFDTTKGWEFTKEETETDRYMYLQLKENKSIIILPLSMKDELNGKNRILINGNVDVYKDEDYTETIRIINNVYDEM